MAPPRKHQTDVILDATRALVLAEGPRAASVGAIAKASGAPAGTLYDRFTNRNGILAIIEVKSRPTLAEAAWALSLRQQYRLLAACVRLSQADFVAPRTGFFPSLRATLNHIMIIDRFYVDAMEGGTLGPAAWAHPVRASLIWAAWAATPWACASPACPITASWTRRRTAT